MTSRRTLLTAVVAALGLTLGTLSAPAAAREPRDRWDTRVFSRVPTPGYPAFAYAHPNGRVYAGTYANPNGDRQRSRVFEWTRSGTLLRSWRVPGQHLDEDHGVQVATSDARGRLVLLEKSTSRALLLSPRTGRFRRYARFADLPTCGPDAAESPGRCSPNALDAPAIPNFAAWGRRGQLFVTDYGQAVVWRVPAGGGRARVWYADPRLDGGEFGTAGLLLTPDRDALLLAQQTSGGAGKPASGTLYRLPLARDRRALRTVWTSRPGDLPDGLGLGRSGRIYLANAGLSQQVVVLAPDGEEVERFPEVPGAGENGSDIPFSTPSSATFLGRRILVANQGYVEGRDRHAILDVAVGERGIPVFVPPAAGRAPGRR